MFSSGKLLRKVSETEYLQVDEKHNFKWERRLNSIALPLQNVKVITSLKTHKKDYDFSGKLKKHTRKTNHRRRQYRDYYFWASRLRKIR